MYILPPNFSKNKSVHSHILYKISLFLSKICHFQFILLAIERFDRFSTVLAKIKSNKSILYEIIFKFFENIVRRIKICTTLMTNSDTEYTQVTN